MNFSTKICFICAVSSLRVCKIKYAMTQIDWFLFMIIIAFFSLMHQFFLYVLCGISAKIMGNYSSFLLVWVCIMHMYRELNVVYILKQCKEKKYVTSIIEKIIAYFQSDGNEWCILHVDRNLFVTSTCQFSIVSKCISTRKLIHRMGT